MSDGGLPDGDVCDGVAPMLRDDLRYIFDNPDECLGTVERNTEIKVVVPVLKRLGWNLARDVAVCFQIPRERVGPGAQAAHAADYALGRKGALVGVGEAKQWSASLQEWKDGREQLERYMRALHVRCGFLTTGRRWLVFAPDLRAPFDYTYEDSTGSTELIARLKRVLAPATIPDHDDHADAKRLWAYGMCPRRTSLSSGQRGRRQEQVAV